MLFVGGWVGGLVLVLSLRPMLMGEPIRPHLDKYLLYDLIRPSHDTQESSFSWHEHAAFQRSAFGQSTAGIDVVATISISLLFFSPFFFFPVFPVFFRHDLFS